MQRGAYLVGVAGGSGSGKTTLIRALRDRLPAGTVCLVSQDDYYHPIERQLTDPNGKVNFDLPNGIDLDLLADDLRSLVSGEPIYRKEYTFNQPNVEPQWLEVKPAPVIDGEVRGFYVLVHEVTEIHEGRRKLADALREIAILLNTVRVHALFSQIDLQGHVIEINDRYCELSGYEREELLAKGFSLLNSGVHPPEFWAEMWRSLRDGKAWRGQICNRAKDGSLFWLDSIFAPIVGADGRVDRHIGTARLHDPE